MRRLVSIVIPTYNRPRMLRDCLRALALDPYADKQVIVVNDGGADVSEVIASFTKSMRVELLELPVNRGHVHARNHGIQHAEGDLLALCDDDDILLPGHLKRMMGCWRRQPDALFFSDAEIVTYTHAHGGRHPIARAPFSFDFDRTVIRRWNTVIPSGILYERKIHDRIGMLDEAMRDYWDWDFILRVSDCTEVRRVPYASTLYFSSATGDNQSSDQAAMTRSLHRFRTKHKLSELPVSSFPLMLQEPALDAHRRPTRLVWDGSLPAP